MVDKVIVKVSGGIGNQLFQVAFGITAGRYLNARVEIDDSSFENYAYHSDLEIQKLELGLKITRYSFESPDNTVLFIKERAFQGLADLKNIPDTFKTIVIDGYWQGEYFFSTDVANLLYRALEGKIVRNPKDFQMANESFREGLALHVRRRDYAHMGRVAEEYYLAAVDYLKRRYNLKSVTLFSDEPNYSKYFLEKGGISNLIVISTGNDWLDLYMMSRFKYVVMSNSTYSWWGAYFAEKELDKTIICPDPWVLISDMKNPCPDRWSKISGAVEDRGIDSIKRKRYGLQMSGYDGKKPRAKKFLTRVRQFFS
jgi:hypothetical protein